MIIPKNQNSIIMAIIRLKFQARNSMIPTRLKSIDISKFDHTGFVEVKFQHEGQTKNFKVPFKRPYSKKPKLSSTVNLNGGADRNLEFTEWERRITDDCKNEVNIECNYTIL